jgi:hypothetical protein
MIIINSDNGDKSTNDIIDWLVYLNEEFIRINDTDPIKLENIPFDDTVSN